MKSIEQLCRELLTKALEDRLVGLIYGSPPPSRMAHEDLVGMANMLVEFMRDAGAKEADREEAVEKPGPTKPPRCERCRWWNPCNEHDIPYAQTVLYGPRGWCQRRPPIPFWNGDSLQPQTRKRDFCGDFEEKA